jgi:hypothetical protein
MSQDKWISIATACSPMYYCTAMRGHGHISILVALVWTCCPMPVKTFLLVHPELRPFPAVIRLCYDLSFSLALCTPALSILKYTTSGIVPRASSNAVPAVPCLLCHSLKYTCRLHPVSCIAETELRLGGKRVPCCNIGGQQLQRHIDFHHAATRLTDEAMLQQSVCHIRLA